MEIKITYPCIEKQGIKKRIALDILKCTFLIAAVVCPVINIVLGGKAWSVIVLLVLHTVYALLLSPDLIEYNRISQFVKFIIYLCVLFMAIDIFIYSGWAGFATSVITCCGLIISGVLFFSDFYKQKKNMFPMFWLLGISIIRAVMGCCLSTGENLASFIFMGVLSFVLLFLFIVTLRKDLIEELRCRFHVR